MFQTYNELIKAGWRMRDIDEMDFLGFMTVRCWAVKKEKYDKEHPKLRKIDEVWNPVRGQQGVTYL